MQQIHQQIPSPLPSSQMVFHPDFLPTGALALELLGLPRGLSGTCSFSSLAEKKPQPSLTREAEKPQQRAGRLILLTFPFSLQCDPLHHMEGMTLTIYRLTGHFVTATLPQGKAAPFHLPKH